MCPSSGFFRSDLVWSFLPTFGSNKDFHPALHLKEATHPDTRCLEDSLKKAITLAHRSQSGTLYWYSETLSDQLGSCLCLYPLLPSSELLLSDTWPLCYFPFPSLARSKVSNGTVYFFGYESLSGASVVLVFPRLRIYDVTFIILSYHLLGIDEQMLTLCLPLEK